ncbi:hypothetical protein HRbin01_01758 [archaeon HR01]|nr:hypothetical protein HRbin01_01758 [archaeon HR01]
MISIFSTFKPFRGHNRVIQLNALRSWLRFCPPCEVIALGDDEGVAEVAKEHGIKHIPELEKNEFGTPLLSSIVKQINRAASHDIICYVNGDIIILGDLVETVQYVIGRFNNFLITADRYSIPMIDIIDFRNPTWQIQLRNLAKGNLEQGPDIFIFRKGFVQKTPPLAVGRGLWSRFFVYTAYKNRIPYIDATERLFLVHQQHDYAHIKSASHIAPKNKTIKKFSKENASNRKLMGRAKFFLPGYYGWVLSSEGLKRYNLMRYSLRLVFVSIFINRRLRLIPWLTSFLIRQKVLRFLAMRIYKIFKKYL